MNYVNCSKFSSNEAILGFSGQICKYSRVSNVKCKVCEIFLKKTRLHQNTKCTGFKIECICVPYPFLNYTVAKITRCHNVKVLHVLIVESAITGSAFMVLLISDAVTVTEDKNGQSLRTF